MPSCFASNSPNVGRLFPNYKGIEQDYFRKTGTFPIMHTIVIRREIYNKYLLGCPVHDEGIDSGTEASIRRTVSDSCLENHASMARLGGRRDEEGHGKRLFGLTALRQMSRPCRSSYATLTNKGCPSASCPLMIFLHLRRLRHSRSRSKRSFKGQLLVLPFLYRLGSSTSICTRMDCGSYSRLCSTLVG